MTRYFNDLPEDVLVEIAVRLDLISAVRFLSSTKSLWKIRKRTQIKNCDVLSPLANTGRWNWGLGSASYLNDLHFIEYFIHKGANRWDIGLRGACSGGHKHLVEYFEKKGCLDTKFNYCMEHSDIADYLQEAGCDWQTALASAAVSGNKERIELCILNGANDWNRALYGAAVGGKKDLIEFFISQGADDWNHGLVGAACGGHIDLIHYFISKGANDWNRAMIYSIPVYALSGVCGRRKAPKENLIEFFIAKGANDWKFAIAEAIEYEHKELAEFFVKQGGSWDDCIRFARKKGYEEIEEHFVKKKEVAAAKKASKKVIPRVKRAAGIIKGRIVRTWK